MKGGKRMKKYRYIEEKSCWKSVMLFLISFLKKEKINLRKEVKKFFEGVNPSYFAYEEWAEFFEEYPEYAPTIQGEEKNNNEKNWETISKEVSLLIIQRLKSLQEEGRYILPNLLAELIKFTSDVAISQEAYVSLGPLFHALGTGDCSHLVEKRKISDTDYFS
jgi:hypothetical protein